MKEVILFISRLSGRFICCCILMVLGISCADYGSGKLLVSTESPVSIVAPTNVTVVSTDGKATATYEVTVVFTTTKSEPTIASIPMETVKSQDGLLTFTVENYIESASSAILNSTNPSDQPTDDATLYQTFAIDGNGNKRALFQTAYKWTYRWIDDETISIAAICYGVGPFGDGFFLVNASTGNIQVVDSAYGGCEGEALPKFSPDGRYMFYRSQFTTLHSMNQRAVCTARSHVWRTDSSEMFLACISEDGDAIYSYAPETDKLEALTTVGEVSFKAASLKLLQDENRLEIECCGAMLGGASEDAGLLVFELEN